jgi:hypothetical protein
MAVNEYIDTRTSTILKTKASPWGFTIDRVAAEAVRIVNTVIDRLQSQLDHESSYNHLLVLALKTPSQAPWNRPARVDVGDVGLADYDYTARLLDTYFKTKSRSDIQETLSIFRTVSTELTNSTTYYVNDDPTNAGVYGYTKRFNHGLRAWTTLCIGFLTDVESQAGTIIHEAMHRSSFWWKFHYYQTYTHKIPGTKIVYKDKGTMIEEEVESTKKGEGYVFNLIHDKAQWDRATKRELMYWCDVYAAFAMAVADKQYLGHWGGIPDDLQRAQRVGPYR